MKAMVVTCCVMMCPTPRPASVAGLNQLNTDTIRDVMSQRCVIRTVLLRYKAGAARVVHQGVLESGSGCVILDDTLARCTLQHGCICHGPLILIRVLIIKISKDGGKCEYQAPECR
jgi:hypothetical protein